MDPLTSVMAPQGMVVTPHHLASQSALAILREGGTAMEAAVAAAATIAVVYPHMNGIGGDGFWLIIPPNGEPIAIEACGAAGSLATFEFFDGLTTIPYKGPKSAITVAGTVGGWQEVLNYVSECGYKRLALSHLLCDAISYAEKGFPVSSDHERCLQEYVKRNNLSKEFKDIFLPDGKVPKVGERFVQLKLAQTFKHLTKYGLNSFYKGELAESIVEDMLLLGMPITKDDLINYTAVRKIPLKLIHNHGVIYNLLPPTQGLVSLSILGILDHLGIDGKDEGKFIHAAVEATKLAFDLRDKYITDPDYMNVNPQSLIDRPSISSMASKIDFTRASSTGKGKGPGDTIWLGVMDNKGFSVSFIQSIYHDFGSGVLLPKTGILWNNRGVAFTLRKNQILSLKAGKKPFHTLNPAASCFKDGRVMIYGTQGGDGQPQTQAAIFHRYVVQGLGLQHSISAPRWLFGRVSGDHDDSLKLENRFSEDTVEYLKERGHDVVILDEYTDKMGHAGMLVRHPDGMLEGACDPRSNGIAAGF